jgi:hypothetical protein
MKRSSLARNLMFVVGLIGALGLVRCGGDEDVSVAQCEDWSRQASIGRRAAQDAAGRDCSVDADCEIVDYGLRCFADCGYPSAVATSAVPALEAAIEALDEDCDRSRPRAVRRRSFHRVTRPMARHRPRAAAASALWNTSGRPGLWRRRAALDVVRKNPKHDCSDGLQCLAMVTK